MKLNIDNIDLQRRIQNLSKRDLARLIGITDMALRYIYTRRSTTMATVGKIAGALQTAERDIITYE